MTITEALQEIVTLTKRIAKKREFIKMYFLRQNHVRDPHEKSGGSATLISQERQAINDLNNNIIDIRKRIAKANSETTVTVCGESKTIEEWLIYRREVALDHKRFLEDLQRRLNEARQEARRKGVNVAGNESQAGDMDLIVHLDEKQLADEIEKMEEILSTLDGKLSLVNATVQV